MILTNCVRPEKVDCSCNPYFDDYDNNFRYRKSKID